MNWNDNVNTQDGHKVKLNDFVKNEAAKVSTKIFTKAFTFPDLNATTAWGGWYQLDTPMEIDISEFGFNEPPLVDVQLQNSGAACVTGAITVTKDTVTVQAYRPSTASGVTISGALFIMGGE